MNEIRIPDSEPALRDNQYVSRPHLNVRRDIAILQKAIELYWYLLRVRVHATDDHSAISRRKRGKPTRGDHHVENRHSRPVGYRLRLHRLADDSDLLRIGTHELRDDDRHLGLLDELRQPL